MKMGRVGVGPRPKLSSSVAYLFEEEQRRMLPLFVDDPYTDIASVSHAACGDGLTPLPKYALTCGLYR